MKSLYLEIKKAEGTEEGIETLGFDLVWTNSNFMFDHSENLGIFNTVNVKLSDSIPNVLGISCSNALDEYNGEGGDFVKLDFKFKDEQQPVSFNIKNIEAYNSTGDINLDISIPPFIVQVSKWIVIGEWR